MDDEGKDQATEYTSGVLASTGQLHMPMDAPVVQITVRRVIHYILVE
jgi:hypothetical protein